MQVTYYMDYFVEFDFVVFLIFFLYLCGCVCENFENATIRSKNDGRRIGYHLMIIVRKFDKLTTFVTQKHLELDLMTKNKE